jgi:hypothetical protein
VVVIVVGVHPISAHDDESEKEYEQFGQDLIPQETPNPFIVLANGYDQGE